MVVCTNCKWYTDSCDFKDEICPSCGSLNLVRVLTSNTVSDPLGSSESMMCDGKWDDAAKTLSDGLSTGSVSKADMNLQSILLEWRKEAAAFAEKYLDDCGGSVRLMEFAAVIGNKFDSTVLEWLLKKYGGLKVNKGFVVKS